jgi:hypothetical protein
MVYVYECIGFNYSQEEIPFLKQVRPVPKEMKPRTEYPTVTSHCYILSPALLQNFKEDVVPQNITGEMKGISPV